jgi:hypothetical protein
MKHIGPLQERHCQAGLHELMQGVESDRTAAKERNGGTVTDKAVIRSGENSRGRFHAPPRTHDF